MKKYIDSICSNILFYLLCAPASTLAQRVEYNVWNDVKAHERPTLQLSVDGEPIQHLLVQQSNGLQDVQLPIQQKHFYTVQKKLQMHI